MGRVVRARQIEKAPRSVGHDAPIGKGASGRDPLQGGVARKTEQQQRFEFPEGGLRAGCAAAPPGKESGPGLVHAVQPFSFVLVGTPQELTSSSLRGTVPAVGRLGDIFMSGASR